MRNRILGFAAALAALGWLGHSLVGLPVILQQIMPGDPYGEAPPPSGAGGAVPTETPLEQPPQETPAGEEEGESPAELRRQAQEAQERAAELLRRSQEEMARGQIAQERADALEAAREGAEEEEETPLEEEEEEEEEPPSAAELAARIAAIEDRLAGLQLERDASEEEIAALQDQLDALDEQGRRLEVRRQQRIEGLNEGMDDIRAVASVLATGGDDVNAALDSLAQRLGATSEDAARYAGEEEARHAAAAQEAVQTAQRLIGQQDLYNARVALRIALRQAMAARQAAQTTGPNPLSP